MRSIYVLITVIATLPSLAQAKEKPAHFVSLDKTELVWVVDVSGLAACPAAAALLAKSKQREVEEIMPTFDGDYQYEKGCIAILK